MTFFKYLRERVEMARLRRHVARINAAMPEAVRLAHERSSGHHTEILASEICGCFYCGKSYSPTEIVDWADSGQTALCPMCGIDSVIGSASGFPITKDFLDEMNRYWF